MKIKNDQKATITVVFATPEGAHGWFEKAVEAGLLEPEAALFQKDYMDDRASMVGPVSNQWIVRREGSRPRGIVKMTTKAEITAVMDEGE